jgi:hypothetical protein
MVLLDATGHARSISRQEFPMRIKQKILMTVLGAGLTLCGVASASASTWQADHPRRVEVNHRLANQDRRIDRDYRDGRITGWQAATLHREDRSIRFQERRDAYFDGSHITRGEDARLNHEENRVSGQIYRDAY